MLRPASKTVGKCAAPITRRRKMCYACFENGQRMCYAVKIRRYRPAVRTADVGKRATMITKRRKMCYAGHATSENVLRRSRNSGKCGKIKKLTLKKVRIVGPMQLHQRSQRWSVRWSDLSVALGSDRLLRSTGKRKKGKKKKKKEKKVKKTVALGGQKGEKNEKKVKKMKKSPHGRFGGSKK